jgi:nicotinate-nucleotide adenylyltransferase
LGLLGGAFNPPHIGHLVLAQEAAAQLGLERVLLIPARQAPHRRIDPEPGPEVRLEMATVAAEGNDLLEASDVETSREGPSYTYETLELLSGGGEDELWFLMGADVAAHLASWRQPERVLELARVGVASRPGTALDEAEAALEGFGAADRAEVVRMPEIGVSSTGIRRRLAQGSPVRYLLPDAVLELVRKRGLYA